MQPNAMESTVRRLQAGKDKRDKRQEAGGPPTAPLKERWPVLHAQYILNNCGEREDEELCIVCFGALCTRCLIWYVPSKQKKTNKNLTKSKKCACVHLLPTIIICEPLLSQCDSDRFFRSLSQKKLTSWIVVCSACFSSESDLTGWYIHRVACAYLKDKKPPFGWHFAFECNGLDCSRKFAVDGDWQLIMGIGGTWK